jgi:hypothetical protein
VTDEHLIEGEPVEPLESDMLDEKSVLEESQITEKPVEFSSSQPPEKVDYPRLPPRDLGSMTPREYIAERLNESIDWYDKNSSKLKSRFLNMRAITVISSALVPVLINLNLEILDFRMDFKIITTILSLLVVVLVSFESVYHYSAQWTNYRSTEQFLRKEYFLFTTREGEYAEVGVDDAYRLFVQRVERAIQAEVATTLQVMNTTSSEGKAEEYNWQSNVKPARSKTDG